jgi:endo-1,4-beta-xylanase
MSGMNDDHAPITGRPLTRRAALGTGAAIAAAGLLPARVAAQAAPGTPGLHAIAQRRNLSFGSCFASGPAGGDRGSLSNPAYAALIERDCGVLVPENEMKWGALRPSPDRFDFARFDAMVAQAQALRMDLRGHTLLWHSEKWFPAWLNTYDFGAAPRAEAERLLATHIRTVTGRYGTRIRSYDVVNEAVEPKTGEMRQTSLSRAFGGAEPVLDHAFHTARAAAPHAELVYNDFMGWEADNGPHRTGVLRLLEGFRKRGVPVDTLGIQSHISFATGAPVGRLIGQLTPEWRRFLDEVTAMGYGLAITEFDVRDRGPAPDLAVRDRALADFTRGFLDVTLSYPQIHDVLAWGMCDKYSWLRTHEPRPTDAVARGCPYDDRFRPKPLHAAIGAALAAAPDRPPRPVRSA